MGSEQSHLNSDAKIADEGRPQGAPLPDSGSLTWVCPNLMQLPCYKLRSDLGQDGAGLTDLPALS